MTVLVTGASGFLGPRVVRHLCIAGFPCIRCFIRPNSDIFALERLRDQYPGTRIEYVVGNLLCLQDAIRATRGVEAVCHLAAEMHGLSPTAVSYTHLDVYKRQHQHKPYIYLECGGFVVSRELCRVLLHLCRVLFNLRLRGRCLLYTSRCV